MLNDLLISGFRALKQLEISKLGRLNLITGQNNSGKSSLLEALRLFTTAGSANVMTELLESRDESGPPDPHGTPAVLSLFHGRVAINDIDMGPKIEIGPRRDREGRLVIMATWFDRDLKQLFDTRRGVPALKIEFLGRKRVVALDQPLTDSLANWYLDDSLPMPSAAYVSPLGLLETNLAVMWDSVNLTDLEDELVACLQLIAPEINKVSLRSPASNGRRVPFVRVSGANRPLPLRTLGDGMARLFGIALSMVNARDGWLLIDEIENGIHYSVQDQLWDFMVKLARRLNVQVFATTHSWDCIKAFQQATSHAEAEGALIRLAWKNGTVRAVEYSEDELAVATQQSIEVR
jgi:ABC-type transport system involved in cytochrome c biogenesis ATPase subunit